MDENEGTQHDNGVSSARVRGRAFALSWSTLGIGIGIDTSHNNKAPRAGVWFTCGGIGEGEGEDEGRAALPTNAP